MRFWLMNLVCWVTWLTIDWAALGEFSPADVSVKFELQTTDGDGFTVAFPREKPLVSIFVMSDCPIANAAAPEIGRVLKQFQNQPIDIVLVYVDADVTIRKIQEHQSKYSLNGAALLDPYRKWSRHLAVNIAPQATVHRADGTLVYQGRIDDCYNDYGKRKAEATSFYLFDAVMAVLAGKVPAVQKTEPIGCHVFQGAEIKRESSWSYATDIAPIFQKNCNSCHRDGQIGPFSLSTFEEIQHRGILIEQVINDRSMPPWKAGKADVEYLHDRRMSSEDIKKVTAWIHDGMPLGDPAKVPAEPEYATGWKLGTPDVIIEMKEAFEVPADGPDIYRNFAIEFPTEFEGKQVWIRGLDFKPSNPAVVHHALFFSAPADLLKGKKSDDGKPGMPGGIAALIARQGLRIPNVVQGSFKNMGGWAAGAELSFLPEGLAYSIQPKSTFILATHFHPTGKVEAEKSRIGLYLTTTPPEYTFMPIQLPPLFGFFKGIDIPAGKSDYLIEDSWTLPCDVIAFGVNSHAHYLGKTMQLTATLPDGKNLKLLNIEDWDFAWQEQYRFTQPLQLPQGTRLEARIRYDNSSANPRNPFSPPRRAQFGEESTDEMGSISLMAYPKNNSDFERLMEQYRRHVREQMSLKPLFTTRLRLFGQ